MLNETTSEIQHRKWGPTWKIHSQIYKFLFSPLNGHTNYVKVIKDGGCWSYIGMSGGEQEISLVGNLGGTHCWD